MSGRGKRRDNTPFAQAIRTLDLKQDDIPTSGVQPPPLYPPLLSKPRPLLGGPQYDYMTTLREDLKERIRQAGYFVPSVTQNRDIERYSDKYQPWSTTKTIAWDRSLYPAELFETGPPPKKRKKKTKISCVSDIAELLSMNLEEDASKSETKDDREDGTAEAENDEEEVVEDEEEEGEDIEEGTDYVINYYDNDENNLDDAEDHLEDTQLY